MVDQPALDEHEEVLLVQDRPSGLHAIIALHDTRLGPAFGGCRMRPYGSEAAALADALRLARGMTFKAAICGLPYGGGKAVIIGDPRRDKSPALLHAMARAVERLAGRYVIADDIGTTLDDLAVMRQVTPYTAAATAAARDALPVTAHGVLAALEAGVAARFGATELAGIRVAVQGLGNVGLPLAQLLHAAGARLIVADPVVARAELAATELGAEIVPPAAIYDAAAEVFAPCALGGVLNDETILRLRARLVCGGANNQLAEARHDRALAARGILYLPDYLANAGGVIDFHQEQIDDRPATVLAAVRRLHDLAADILAEARADQRTPLAVADERVAARLAAAGPPGRRGRLARLVSGRLEAIS
jgi:leucine dehydrogenase